MPFSLQSMTAIMNILIIGAGQLGRKTAEMLDAAGHDVIIVDESEDNISLINQEFDGVSFVGFPLDINTLRRAGVESCDAVAVATSDDNLNITVGQIVKNFFGISNVVARISDPYRESIFAGFGLQTVCPTNMAGEKLVNAIISPLESKQLNLGTSTIAFETAPAEKKFANLSTSQIELKCGYTVFGIIHADGSFSLKENGVELLLAADDRIVYCRKID